MARGEDPTSLGTILSQLRVVFESWHDRTGGLYVQKQASSAVPPPMTDGPELMAFAEDPAAFVETGRGEERVETGAAVVTFEPGDHFWSTSVTARSVR